MDQAAIIEYIAQTFPGVEVVTGDAGIGAGDTFFFYDPQRNTDPTRRIPFATIVTKDYGDFDNKSNLNRPDVFRLNIQVGRATLHSLFNDGETFDYAALDQLLPHPVYAPQGFMCVLNPSRETFESRLEALLAQAYANAARRK
jgi:hypothetical protein